MTHRGPILFAVLLLAIVVVVGGWLYSLQPAKSYTVSLKMTTDPTNVLVGDQFTLSVALTNDSGAALSNASIALVLPANVIAPDSPGQRVVTQSLGSVEPGAVSHRDFHLVVTSGANAVAHFGAKVTYAVLGSTAQFEYEKALDIAVGQTALGVSVAAPASVFSGQNFPITISYHNNTNHPIQGMKLAMQYPQEFTFTSASSSFATDSNGAWDLGTIPPNDSGAIVVKGDIVGSENGPYQIVATLSKDVGGQMYVIANPSSNISLADSPLTFTMSVNNSKNYVSGAGDSLNYTFTFKNNSTVTFQNIIITAALKGGMFDFSSLQTRAAFNSLTNVVTWNGAAEPKLLSLPPGDSGSVTFNIRTKAAYPIRLLSDKNYIVNVHAKLATPTVPAGTTASSTVAVADLTTKLGGKIALTSKAYWHDPTTTGFPSAGPYPPKVNQATKYDIHWLITNYATDAKNVSVSGYLQSGTTCTGQMKTSVVSSTFSCEPSTGLVRWQIPVVPATTGITGKPFEAVFQIQNTPSVNQMGHDVTLMGSSALTAVDGFTSSSMRDVVAPITTSLPDDTSTPPNIIRQVGQ